MTVREWPPQLVDVVVIFIGRLYRKLPVIAAGGAVGVISEARQGGQSKPQTCVEASRKADA